MAPLLAPPLKFRKFLSGYQYLLEERIKYQLNETAFSLSFIHRYPSSEELFQITQLQTHVVRRV